MKKLMISVAVLLFCPNVALAQNNPNVTDFSATSFDDCISGADIQKLTGVNNPMRLLGALTYIGPIMKSDGTIGTGWVRQPMALPLVNSDSTSPDVATCSKRFETTADGGINVLGISVSASKNEVYSVRVRLIARQSVAPVPVGNTLVQPWYSDRYKGAFQATVAATPTGVNDFFVFDDIAIYLLEVERYRKEAVGIAGVVQFISGSANYKRDEEFKGARVIVTGTAVPLSRSAFVVLPTIPNNQPPLTTAPTSQVIATIPSSDVGDTQRRVMANAQSNQ